MKFRKLVIACGVFATALAVSMPTAVSVSAAETVSDTDESETQGVTADSESAKDLQENNEDTSEWDDKLIVVIDENSKLNIREEGNTNCKILGKITRGTIAEIIAVEGEWTKIRVNDIEGYVKNEYCHFADEAQKTANEICDMVATANADSVRVREAADTEAKILRKVNEGDALLLADESEQTSQDWVAVVLDDEVAYISAAYVEIGLGTASITEAAPASAMVYSARQFRSMGVANYGGYRWTWYSQRVLPGGGLRIPGRHVDENGYVCDGDGYICLASSTLGRGSVVSTPFGKSGKVYDSGCAAGTLDVYVSW